MESCAVMNVTLGRGERQLGRRHLEHSLDAVVRDVEAPQEAVSRVFSSGQRFVGKRGVGGDDISKRSWSVA
jgi:hypothetical protein